MVSYTTISSSSCKYSILERRRQHDEFRFLCFSRDDDLARAWRCYKSIPRKGIRPRSNQFDLGSRDAESSPSAIHLLLVSIVLCKS